jgi:hypothetical protein
MWSVKGLLQGRGGFLANLAPGFSELTCTRVGRKVCVAASVTLHVPSCWVGGLSTPATPCSVKGGTFSGDAGPRGGVQKLVGCCGQSCAGAARQQSSLLGARMAAGARAGAVPGLGATRVPGQAGSCHIPPARPQKSYKAPQDNSRAAFLTERGSTGLREARGVEAPVFLAEIAEVRRPRSVLGWLGAGGCTMSVREAPRGAPPPLRPSAPSHTSATPANAPHTPTSSRPSTASA